MRIGIRLAIYDDHDNELHSESAWLPGELIDLDDWRSAYDTLCAALWSAVGRLVDHQRNASGAPR